MNKKYVVKLTAEERVYLENFITTDRRAPDCITRARILLKADSNQPDGSWSDQAIAAALDVGVRTVERVRRRFVELGLEASLIRQSGGGRKQKCLNSEQEAQLIALVRSETPNGQAQWTLRLLAQQMVQLGYVDTVSHETIRQTLKKMNYSLGNKIVNKIVK